MRKMRLLVAICFALIVTPMLMGARQITWSVTTNPGGIKGQIQAGGNYTLENTDKFMKVNYTTTNVGTGATPSLDDATGGGTWKVLQTVPAGTYNPNKATVYYADGNNNMQNFPSTIKGNYTVK